THALIDLDYPLGQFACVTEIPITQTVPRFFKQTEPFPIQARAKTWRISYRILPIAKVELRNDPDEWNATPFVRRRDVVHDTSRIALDLLVTNPFRPRNAILQQCIIDFRKLG